MDSLAHAQELIYHLLNVIPSPYQRQSLQAWLALFLRAQNTPLPEHSSLKAPRTLSHSLNVYSWSVRVIRRLREALRQQLYSSIVLGVADCICK